MWNFDTTDRERDEGVLSHVSSYECEKHHHADCLSSWCECGCHDIEEDLR